MKLGAQLFTVRQFTQTLDDFAETLKKTADIGYKVVQVSGTCPFDAEWLKEQLDKNGLECAITHTAQPKIYGETEKTIADHKIFGCNYIGIGSLGELYRHMDASEAFKEIYTEPARKIKDASMKLMYHNHGYEFIKTNGVTFLERLANSFTPDELGFTLDSYWVQYAGADPAEWVKKLSGRVDCVHAKDMKFTPDMKHEMAYVGEGNINFDRFLSACEDAGTKYVLVEQDDCQDRDPFFCLKKSYEYLTSMGLK